ncbi:tetratricopeptide repeat protein [Xanthomonas melonis]|uniref:tetratricopeptide repeat protein n=1 Tax=Xanthomonas melonis TaxID=56456 RepID=UPI003EBDC558
MKSNDLELDPQLYEDLKVFAASGDRLAAQGDFEKAIAEYNKAWKLLPEPKNNWEAATWLLAAIADACFLAGFTKSAYEALEYAMTCPGAIGNPFLHLRYGQVLFDSGEFDAAADELMRAYMGDGLEIFSAENDKYINFLKERAVIEG